MHTTTRALACAAALAAAVAAAAPADAHTEHRPAPRATDIVGVGGDMSETLFDGLGDVYNAEHPGGNRFYSYASSGPSPLTPKRGCAPIARPDGSSAGIAALAARQTLPNGQPCLDYARGTRDKQPTDPKSLEFLPFASDGITWAANANGNAPQSMTPQQMAAILTCKVTTWDQVGGTSKATIKPLLPDVGVGILGFLKTGLGIDQPGPCVGEGVQQDSGSDPQVAGDPNAVVFYSIGKYLAQTEYHHQDDHGNLTLRDIAGVPPTVYNPKSHRVELNIGQAQGIPNFPVHTHQYVVVDRNADGSLPAQTKNLFVGQQSWLCRDSWAKAQVANHGFMPLIDGTCGVPFID